MTKPFPDFIHGLERSRLDAFLVADWCQRHGYAGVRVFPAPTVPDEAEYENNRAAYADHGDIEVCQRLEVKRSRYDFRALKEFPRDPFIVDEAFKVEQYHPRTLHAYVILNASRSGFLFVSAATRARWVKETKHDSREGKDIVFMMCPLECAVYVAML